MMPYLERALRAVRHDAGNVTVMAASTLVLVMVVVALVVDIGSVVLTRRNLQTATDLAALAAARNPPSATTIATNALVNNHFAAANLKSATSGSYQLDLSTNATSRFVAHGTSQPEAVEVVTQADAPLHFFRAVAAKSTVPVTARAVAVHGREATFSAGTGLASLSAGALNSLLTSLLGSNVALDLMSYQGLIDTDINLLSFLDALAVEIAATVGTYDELLDAQVQFGTLVDAALAVTTDPTARSALTQLPQSIKTLKLGDLVDLGLWSGMALEAGQRPSAAEAKVSLFELLTLAAQLANGSNFINIPLSVNLPGIASVSVKATMIERPQIAVGPEGTSIHTAQTRLQVSVQLLPLQIGLLTASVVNLPLYLELANGDATIDDIACGLNPKTDGSVTISARSGIASAYIGTVTDNAMTNFTQPVTVHDADIVNVLGILKVTGSASATMGSTVSQPLTFSVADMADTDQRTKRIDSGLSLTNLISTLIGNLHLSVSLLGSSLLSALLGLTLGLVQAVVTPVLTAALSVVEPVINSVLLGLGVQLGYMDVTARGMRCGAVALVQ